MKTITLRISIFCLLFALVSFRGISQSTIKEITDKFFILYSSDPLKAIDYAFSTNKWFETNKDGVDTLKNTIKEQFALLGEYYGYEEISEKTAGQSTTMVTFIVRYDKEPIRFSFLFYKPKDVWRVNNFSYDENIGKDLDDASKFYFLRENMPYKFPNQSKP
jgi:hypothetical protein